MPFTPTHVLAITPAAAAFRGWLPFSALAIGSMIPDLPLFVPLAPDYATTHSLSGLFTTCLPLGMLGFIAFQAAMKRPLIALLPATVRCRCAAVAGLSLGLSVRAAVRVASAVTIGAATHVVWDAFTHRGRWGTRLVPWLDTTALTIAGHAVPGYKAMQYGSTAVGLPLLAVLAVVWLSRQVPAPLKSVPGVPLAVRVTVILGALGILTVLTRPVWVGGGAPVYERVGQSIGDSGLALIIAVLVYCLLFRAFAGRRGSLVRTPRSQEGEQDSSSGPPPLSPSAGSAPRAPAERLSEAADCPS
jgi:hypothetical protein